MRRNRWTVLIGVLALLASALAGIAGPPAAHAGSGPAPVSRWLFDEGTGQTAGDSAGTHPATLAGNAGWTPGVQGPSALSLDGAGDFADAGASVIDTSQSFTASGWMRLDRLTGYQTLVSVDGIQVSGFYLQFRDDTRRFAFVKLPADASAGAPAFPSATFDPVAGQWYQLTGVFDATARTLSLYVDGQLQGTTPAPATWVAGGNLVIGRGHFGGNPVDFVDGGIDDVRVWAGALTAAEVAQLATGGSWRFDEGTGTTAEDDSLFNLHGTLTGGAGWTPGVVGASAVEVDGSTGFVDMPAPVVDTSQSFSVATWVRSDVPTGFRTAVSVDGESVSGFFLQLRNDGRLAFTVIGADTGGPGVVAGSGFTARTGQWYHLVGVHDRAAGTVSLYVNGSLQQTVAHTTPWRAGGHFVVGRAKFNGGMVDFWDGAVDDVRTFPFPVDAGGAAALATSGLWHLDEGTGTVAANASPDAEPATLRGAGATWTAGASGPGVALDGTSDVFVADRPALNIGTGSASLAAWVRTSSAAFQPVVSKGTDDSGYGIAVSGGRVIARIGGGTDRLEVSTVTAPVADGQWHSVAFVLDRLAQRLRLYVDGEAANLVAAAGSCGMLAAPDALDTGACPAASGDSTAPFTMGSTAGAAPRLTGAVDEVRLVRFALTGEQVAVLAGANGIAVDATDIRATTRRSTYGLILEDISHSVDGGVYAELVRNRTFKEPYQPGSGPGSGPVPYWSLVTGGGATGSIAIDEAQPLNDAIDRSLRVHIGSLARDQRLGAANIGYYGIAVRPSTTYRGSLWARTSPGWQGTVQVSLEKPDGTVLASRALSGVGTGWAEHEFTLRTPAGIAPSTDNRLVVSLRSNRQVTEQDVWLSVVSLFPPTYKNRPNGLRPDLAEKFTALKPGLLRVPGGNYLEGVTLETRFDWKKTLGPIEQRAGHQNTAWGYWSTDGMGLLEYLRMAEDIGAEPLLGLFAGYTLNGEHVPEEEFEPYIQDALEEIEYVIGDTSTVWGARRAADGHPAPFPMSYVEVGNEDWFDTSGSYAWRFTRMYDAIKARYPQLKVIASTGGLQGGAASSTPTGRVPDLSDDHYYAPPSFFANVADRYDRADRTGRQYLIGEYGAQEGNPTPTLRAAVGEAAMLTGLERNSDMVIGSMYAPILVHENDPNWPSNMVGFDAGRSYGSPSYWVVHMFANNLGAQVIGSRLTGAGALEQVVTKTVQGGTTTFYVKIVNTTTQIQTARLSFHGVSSIDGTGTRTVLTGDPSTRNTLDQPGAVQPVTEQITGLGPSTRLSIPASSVTVLRVTGH
ncbi:MAG TPA: LamG-like jellyroll fold domain-containing protein [Candidatus Limnocylindrales bacterium]